MILHENGELGAPRSFETPVNFCGSALRRISENGTPHFHHSKNFNLQQK